MTIVMRTARQALAFAALVMAAMIIAGCDGEHPRSVGEHVVYQEVLKEVPRPCPVTKPARPAPLAKPLPTAPRALIDILTAKLKEVLGGGGYVDQADAALDICTRPAASH